MYTLKLFLWNGTHRILNNGVILLHIVTHSGTEVADSDAKAASHPEEEFEYSRELSALLDNTRSELFKADLTKYR